MRPLRIDDGEQRTYGAVPLAADGRKHLTGVAFGELGVTARHVDVGTADANVPQQAVVELRQRLQRAAVLQAAAHGDGERPEARPVAGGVEFVFGDFLVGARFTYRFYLDNNFVNDPANADFSAGLADVQATLGFRL